MSYVPCRCAVCAACCDAACAAHLMVRRRPRERRRRKLHASHTNARCALKSLLAAYFRRFLDELLLNGHAARMGVCEDSTAGVRAFAARCIWCNVLARVGEGARASGAGQSAHRVRHGAHGGRIGRRSAPSCGGICWLGCAVAHTVGKMGDCCGSGAALSLGRVRGGAHGGRNGR